MRVDIICDGELIDKHKVSIGRKGSNAFGDFTNFVPGDILNIGATYYGRDKLDKNPDIPNGARYVVQSREFKTYETWNNSYTGQYCVLNVKKVEELEKTDTKNLNSF